MLSPENEEEEFDFYLKFAKPLVLNLPDTSDRIKAATWIRYLKNNTTDPVLRGEYLKLLLFVLQRRKLFGPFASIPDENEPLEKFPDEINIQDVAKNFVEVDKKILKATLERGGFGEWPPYTTACSSDLTEYASSQEIPNFGVQAYYAISRDPLQQWDHFEKAIFPIGEDLDSTQAESSVIDTPSPANMSCFVAADHGEPVLPLSPPRPVPRIPPGGPRDSTPPKELGDVSPRTLKQPVIAIDEFNMDPRISPTWGSNFVKARDPPSPLTRQSPTDSFNIEVSDQDMLDFFNDDIDLFEADLDDISSYFQGESLTSPPKARPTSPLSTASTASATRPAGTPREFGPYPQIDIDELYDSMSKYVDNDTKIIEAKLPATTPQRSPSPKRPSGMQDSPVTRRSLSPDKLFDALEHVASDKGDQLTSPIPSESPNLCTADTKASEKEKQAKEVTDAIQEILEEMNQPSTNILKTTGDLIQETIMNKSAEGLGGDSFIASDQKDYRWLNEMTGGPGLPQNEQQDPALWDSFGWWTDDPDDIFMYSPPSPRVYGTPEPDPCAAQRERWADVNRTPPIFSKDPKIRESKAAQRIYSIEEFGMESFEEPVWTSAEQYFKYKNEPSPFIDHRQIDRKTLDPSQFPKYGSPEMQRFTEIQGTSEEEDFFSTQIAPDLINVSFGEKDFKNMTKLEAVLEAVQHGPQNIGVVTSTPKKTPEKDEGEWADIIEETPPLFMLEPPFLATPPEYEPNPDIKADELEDSIFKYIEEDLKIIRAKIPVTTPQRSPPPKRVPMLMTDSLQFPKKYVVPPQKHVDWDTNIGSPLRMTKTDAVVTTSEDELQEKNIKRKQQLKLLYERQFDSPPKIPTPPSMPHLMDEPIPSRRLPSAMPATKLPPANWDWKTPPSIKKKTYTAKKKTTPTGIRQFRPVSRDISMYYESPPQEFLSPSMAVSSLMFSPPEDFGKEPSPIRSPGGRPVSQGYREYDEIDMEALFPTEFQEFESPELYQSPPEPESLTPERKAWRDKVGEHEKTDFRKKTFVVRPKPGRSYRVTGSKRPSLGALVETSPPEPDIAQLEMEAEIAALEAELFSETSVRRPRQAAPNNISPDYDRRMWQESLKLHDNVPYQKNKRFNVAKRRGDFIEIGRHSQGPSLPTIHSPRNREFQQQQRQDELRRMKHMARAEVEADKEEIKSQPVDYYKYNRMLFGFDHPFTTTSSYGRVKMRPQIDLPKSPEEYVSPERPLHIFDEPLPEGLPGAMPASKLPPANWDWKTPPNFQKRTYTSKRKTTPTGISPIRPVSRDISMYYESPPQEFLSPSLAVSSLMFSPPEDFGKEPSPIRSPGGRPVSQGYREYDEIDMEALYPTGFQEFDSPELYQSPPEPESLTPERKAWRDKVGEHEKTDFRNKTFVVRPKPGRSYRVTGSKRPLLGALAETSPPEPDIAQLEMEAEIAELEAELFSETSVRRPRQAAPNNISPDYERRMWQESLKLHDNVPYQKNKRFNVAKRRGDFIEIGRHSQGPSLPTIHSPRNREFQQQQRQDELRRMKHMARAEVEADKEEIKSQPVDYYKYNRMLFGFDHPFTSTSSYGRVKMRPQIDLPKSPEEYVSPERPPHIFDEPLPEGLPGAMPASKLPPANWDWKTPPNFQKRTYTSKRKATPTGISPIRPVSRDISMYYESPPQEFLSPSMAVSSLMFSPPEDFGKEPSPIRSPGGRPVSQGYREYDEIDMEALYPTGFQEFDSPELYQSPPEPESLTPERKAWRDKVGEHEKTDFRNKTFVVRPKPGRSYRLTGSKRPSLGALAETSPPEPDIAQLEMEAEIAALEAELFSETSVRRPRQAAPNNISPDYERRMWQESLKLHDNVPYQKNKRFNVAKRRGDFIEIGRHSQGPSLPTIHSPRNREFQQQQRQDELRRMKHMARAEVEADKEEIKSQPVDYYKYNRMLFGFDHPFTTTSSYGRVKMRPQIDLPKSPEEYVSPERPPHIFDEPLPEGLPGAMPASKLPPANWDWKTPLNFQKRTYTSKRKTTPTGISPIRPVSRDISMYYESPPQEFLSPSMAVSSLMFSPPEDFGKEPSPIRSPGGRPVSQGYREYDEIDMEALYPTGFQEFDSPELYQSPPEPESLTPERKAWRDKVGEHEKTDFRNKTFVVRPKPGRSYRLTGSKRPSLGALAETSPPDRQRQLAPDIVQLGDIIEIGRPSQGPSLPTIHSPRNREFQQQQTQDELRRMKHMARAEVEADKEEIKSQPVDYSKYNSMLFGFDHPFTTTSSYGRVKMRPQIDLPKSPEEYVSPERPPHIFDEPLPEGLPGAMPATKLPPANWAWTTPPKYQRDPYVPKPKVRPTGISTLVSPEPPMHIFSGWSYKTPPHTPVRLPSPESLFYESPPMMSPLLELSPPSDYLDFRGTSPIRSPGGRPITPTMARRTDDFDVAPYYPTGYESLDEEASPDLYFSPESAPSTIEEFLDEELATLEAEVLGKRGKKRRPLLAAASPPTPEPLRRAWQQDLSLHENVPYRKKSFDVKPKPGKSYRVTKSKQPKLTTVEEKYYEWSPVSPPLKPRQYPEFQRDVPLHELTDPPENWSWHTPSPLTRRGLNTESPPLVYSPETPPELFSPTFQQLSLVKTPTEESLSITVLKKPNASSPLRSPGGRPFLQPLQGSRLDALERARTALEDYDLLTEESPELYDYTEPSPPAPPPMPRTPSPYIAQPRRIPRKQAPLDPNVLYAATPQSAARNYQPDVERIRFEQTRPMRLRPVTPPRPPRPYYETPIAPAPRPWKKQRKPIGRTSRRRLEFEFEDVEREFEREMMEDLEAHLSAASPTGHHARDILGESPPSVSDELDEVSMFGDFDYEPAEFNIYADDAPQYNMRPAFEGQPDVDLMDTSMMEQVDEIPYEQRDFRWMNNCGTRCLWKR